MGHYPEESCIDDGDTTWMLVSSVLVLGMIPALAFFEAGLLRSRNTVSLVTQTMGGILSLSVAWQVIGFSMVFGRSLGGVIGNPLDHLFLMGVAYDDCNRHAPTIPAALFAFFQMMFAAITPLLTTGAFAERLTYRTFYIFVFAWEILVFYPVAHWIWGDGWLGAKSGFGVLDFAGGITIHATAGSAALVCAIVIGRRKDFDKYHGEFPPSNIPLAALGCTLLWIGWFGFNAGSALTSGSLATIAAVNTQRAAVMSGFVWLVLSWVRNKPSSVATINGIIAGLAGITPASGYINPQFAPLVGSVIGISSYFSVILCKEKLRIDDALDVSSVHGLPGIIGALAIGILGQKEVNSNGGDGLIFGNPRLLAVQVFGVVVSSLWSALVTLFLLWALKRIFGRIKIDEDEEEYGLDAIDHEEKAYNYETPKMRPFVPKTKKMKAINSTLSEEQFVRLSRGNETGTDLDSGSDIEPTKEEIHEIG